MDRSLKQYSLKENCTEDSKSVIFALKKKIFSGVKKTCSHMRGTFCIYSSNRTIVGMSSCSIDAE